MGKGKRHGGLYLIFCQAYLEPKEPAKGKTAGVGLLDPRKDWQSGNLERELRVAGGMSNSWMVPCGRSECP